MVVKVVLDYNLKFLKSHGASANENVRNMCYDEVRGTLVDSCWKN